MQGCVALCGLISLASLCLVSSAYCLLLLEHIPTMILYFNHKGSHPCLWYMEYTLNVYGNIWCVCIHCTYIQAYTAGDKCVVCIYMLSIWAYYVDTSVLLENSTMCKTHTKLHLGPKWHISISSLVRISMMSFPTVAWFKMASEPLMIKRK